MGRVGRSGWTRLGQVLAGGVVLGFGIAYGASALGLPESTVYSAWFVGGALSTGSLVLLLLWGLAEVCRRLFGGAFGPRRRAGDGPAAAAPPAAALPGRGWNGWRILLGGADHEVWVSPDDKPRFICDGTSVEPDLRRVGRYGRPWRAFNVAGHPATLIPETDWGSTARGFAILAPIVLLLATLGGTGAGGGGSLPTRWRLLVDDLERPDTERVRVGAAPKPSRGLRAEPPRG